MENNVAVEANQDVANTDPGEGYRLLGNNEVIRVGDECLGTDAKWYVTGNFDFGTDRDNTVTYRRKVAAPTCSPGYRFLQAGETIQAGDEVDSINGWKPVSQTFLELCQDPTAVEDSLGTIKADDVGYWRRKVS